MRAPFVKLIAVWFIVLGVCPFTAPFATCDFDLLHGGATGATAVKTTTDPDETLALPAAFHFVTPLFSAVAAALVRSVDSSSKTRISPRILRL